MGVYDILVTVLYFIVFPIYLRSKYPLVIVLLFFYHTIFVLTYWNNLKDCGADACVYWFITRFNLTSSDTWFSYFGLSTNFMLFIDYPLVKFLKLDFLSGFLLYGLVGFCGILNLYKILKHYDYGKINIKGISLCIIILFFPNMHYWTCAIGKDALSFFSISTIFLFLVKNKKIGIEFFLISAFLFLVRPHVAVFLLSAIGIVFVLNNKKLSVSKRVLLGAVGIIIIPLMVSATLSFVGLNADMDEITENFQTTSFKLAAKAASAIPMNEYSLPLKIFTFLFRPFIFDINNVQTFILVVENTLALILFIWAFKLRLKWKIKLPYQIQAILLFSLIATFFYSYRDTNLGIIIRMKNQLFPFLLVFPFYIISYSTLGTLIKSGNNKLIYKN
ncbi:hypothetical protein [Parafilimonas sp.]|uniref:hypothetical protein n=1 Tax=Parafilimonas sp. TaxID=1969739 RepID=UPI003F7DB6F3